ncbi:hypothetical protein BT93_E2165 [Corymbia citriodora subsp. variegata]|nr:hypothetical protein BT93_E2165 [Corymbia citriodora subsp. variegata]
MGAPLRSHTNIDNNFEKTGALKRKIKRLSCREADIRDELEYATSLSLKKQRMEVKNWLADVEKLRDEFHSIEATSKHCLLPHQQVDILMQEVEDLMEQGKFPKGLFVARETKINKLIEQKLVGEAFQRNTTKILEYLVGNQISRLGIYGMGGVGKTTLMVHIHNRLLEEANHDNVLWITVSQDFNSQKLQDKIWEALSSGQLQEKDVRKRAAMLFDVLTKREKLIIILDDVWERFDLEEVGIPIRVDGVKLVLTTRSFDVCRQMHCQEKIKIEPLSLKEAKSLFLEEFGSEVTFNLETKAVVGSIVKECAGLPLAIITMAASMRGVTDVFEWKDCLVKLKESDMEKKVLMNLKFSYDCLENHEVQQCFLSCALYPEDNSIGKNELIEFFIDQGFIDGLDRREKQYNRGLTILNKLENVCLLEKAPDHSWADDRERLKMHDLIRDMALHIMSATSIVKPGKGLMRIPPECWTEALEKVSLMENKISKFSLNISPNCPRLSTLLLNVNHWLKDVVIIPDSFFRQFCGLKVLNLSRRCLRELPNSISNLVNLRALLLSHCWELRRIPYLGKLTSLRKLDTRNCENLEAPEGLGMLMNLRYLDLNVSMSGRLPKGILGGLLNLQHLKVRIPDGEDITKLRALETLECCFEGADDFNKCVRVVIEQGKLQYYYLCMHNEIHRLREIDSDTVEFRNRKRRVDIASWSHAIVSMGGECTGIFILIPRDVQILVGSECDGVKNLSGIGPLEYLEKLRIEKWEKLEVLCGGQDEVINIRNSPAPTPTPLLFPSLRVLKIHYCPKLKYLFGHGSNLPHLGEIEIWTCIEMVGITAAVTSPPPHLLPAFPNLERIVIRECGKMKRVVESEWMPHFPNLRTIWVGGCKKMEEIIGGPPPHASVEKISLESLSTFGCNNMRKLFPQELLLHLRNLQKIWVSNCKGMVEMISGAGQGQEGSMMTPVNNTPSSFQSSISLPNLRGLKLSTLPQLKSICGVPISCGSIKGLEVYDCPELKAIPLQLRLRDIHIEELPYIWVEDEEKWKMLMWDDPNAQAILQPYLRKRERYLALNAIG